MEKLNELASRCRYSIDISINEHRNCFNTVEQYIDEETRKDINADVFAEMIRMNTIVRIQIYPKTANIFYIIHHFDLEKAIDIALQAAPVNNL